MKSIKVDLKDLKQREFIMRGKIDKINQVINQRIIISFIWMVQ